MTADQPFSEVESTKSVSDVYAPVSGTVAAAERPARGASRARERAALRRRLARRARGDRRGPARGADGRGRISSVRRAADRLSLHGAPDLGVEPATDVHLSPTGRAPTRRLEPRSASPTLDLPANRPPADGGRSTSNGGRGGDSAWCPNLDPRSRARATHLEVRGSGHLTLPLSTLDVRVPLPSTLGPAGPIGARTLEPPLELGPGPVDPSWVGR